MVKKYIFPLILMSILGLTACGQKTEIPESVDEPMRVNVVSVKQSNITPTLQLTGTVTAREDIAIGTSLTGQKITAVLVEVGQSVKKGQVLARLDSVNVQSQLKQNQMALAKAQASLNARQAELREANATFARYGQLVGMDAVSRQEFDQQRLRMESAQANIKSTQAEIAQIQSQIIDSQHQRNKAEIIAPADGVISQRTAEVGALAGSDALFHLIKNGEMEFSAQANADELAQLKVGMPAQIHIRGNQNSQNNGQTFSGSLRVISPQMDNATRLGKVLIAFENSQNIPQNIPNGAFGEATIQLPAHSMGMALPSQAVSFLDNGQAFVMLVNKVNNQHQIKRQTVQIGQQIDGWIEITSGLNAGDTVVKNASAFVSDGDVVLAVVGNE